MLAFVAAMMCSSASGTPKKHAGSHCDQLKRSTMFKMMLYAAGAAATAVLLGACALGQVKPGASRGEAISHYGQPTAVVPLASGSRLQYSYQPAGSSAVMVDLDAAGRVVSTRQVLHPREFSRVEAGKWTRRDIEREFGRPATIDRVASWPGDVMTYRWREDVHPMFFWVYLDAGNVVQRIGQGMEFPMRPNDN